MPRACTSCRRRKIRCDVSKTKAWPCAACVSKKVICVPHNMVHNKHIDIPCLSDLAPDPLQYNSTMPHHADYQHHLAAPYDTTSQSTASTGPITQDIHQYLSQTDGQSQQPAYGQPSSQVPARELDPSSSSTSRCVGMAVPPIPTTPTAEHDEPSWDATPVIMLLDALDGLKIDYKGTGKTSLKLRDTLLATDCCSIIHYGSEEEPCGDTSISGRRSRASASDNTVPHHTNPRGDDAAGRTGT